MKKLIITITALIAAFFWLTDCTMKGGQDYASDYIYHNTPSPSITPTRTVTPYVTPTPTCSGLFCRAGKNIKNT